MNPHSLLSAFSEWFWPQVAEHVWQTTLFTALAWATAFSLRRAGAAARHTIWLLASWRLALPTGLLACLFNWRRQLRTGGTSVKERIARITNAPARLRSAFAAAAIVAITTTGAWPALGGFLVRAGQQGAKKLLPGIEWVRIKSDSGQLVYDSSQSGSAGAPEALLFRERRPASGLPAPYRKWLDEDVAYLITDAERAEFLKLKSDQDRERFIEQFWQRRDPSPGTTANEFKEEHYRRISYANERFADDGPGWRTARGRVYIKLGPCDEIESHPFDRYEVWKYSRWGNRPESLFVKFVLPD